MILLPSDQRAQLIANDSQSQVIFLPLLGRLARAKGASRVLTR
jgi:hypothetical protein